MFEEVKEQIALDAGRMEDKEYLTALNQKIVDKASYIIVRKGGKIYYNNPIISHVKGQTY